MVIEALLWDCFRFAFRSSFRNKVLSSWLLQGRGLLISTFFFLGTFSSSELSSWSKLSSETECSEDIYSTLRQSLNRLFSFGMDIDCSSVFVSLVVSVTNKNYLWVRPSFTLISTNLSWQKLKKNLATKFHGSLHMQEFAYKSKTINRFNFQIVNSLKAILGVHLTWFHSNGLRVTTNFLTLYTYCILSAPDSLLLQHLFLLISLFDFFLPLFSLKMGPNSSCHSGKQI